MNFTNFVFSMLPFLMIDLHNIFTDSKQPDDLSVSDILKLQSEYPYCLNLHYILLEKAGTLGKEHLDTIIKKVATFSIDRQHLKDKIQGIRARMEQIEDETEEQEVSNIKVAKPEEKASRVIVTQKVRILDKPKEPIKPKQNKTTPVQPQDVEQSDKQEQEIVKKQKSDKSKKSFDEWLGSLKASIKVKKDEILQEKPKKKKKKEKKKDKKKKKKKLEQLLAKSKDLVEQEIVTETLADIMAQQGYIDKAREMYKKLSLLFPEKSSYFAGKIKELKNLDNV